MNLKEQQYIVTLANYGNMTQAAKKLGVTQPALSSYLASVENGLGFPLFERTGRRLIPTYLGEVYLEKARKILALGEEFQQQVGQVISGYQGRLRVGVPLRRAPQLIPSALKVFRRSYPNIDLSFQEGNQGALRKLLDQDQLDLMLCNLAEPQSDLTYLPVYRDPVVFLVQNEHPCARYAQYRDGFSRPWIDLKRFESEVFILQHEGQSLRRYANQVLELGGVQPLRTLLIRNIEASAQMASMGLGVAFCLESYLQYMHFVNPPQIFSVGERQQYAEFSVAYYKGKQLPDYTRHFIQFLKELLEYGPSR